MRFTYNVITNGIGGIYAGGVENDNVFRDGTTSLILKLKIYDFLIKKENIDQAIKDGYIIHTSTYIKQRIEETEKYNMAIKEKRKALQVTIKSFIEEILPHFPDMGKKLTTLQKFSKILKAYKDKRLPYNVGKEKVDRIRSFIVKRNNLVRRHINSKSHYKLSDKGYNVYKLLTETAEELKYIKG